MSFQLRLTPNTETLFNNQKPNQSKPKPNHNQTKNKKHQIREKEENLIARVYTLSNVQFSKKKKITDIQRNRNVWPFQRNKIDNDPEEAPPLRLLDKGFLKTASLKRLKELQEDKDKGKQGINEIRISIK